MKGESEKGNLKKAVSGEFNHRSKVVNYKKEMKRESEKGNLKRAGSGEVNHRSKIVNYKNNLIKEVRLL